MRRKGDPYTGTTPPAAAPRRRRRQKAPLRARPCNHRKEDRRSRVHLQPRPGQRQYLTGTTGMLAFGAGPELTDAMIASWSSGGAPASSGTHDSSSFIGVEDPLDEGDRWYPLPGYSGFRKAGGVAMGRDLGHNATGAWSIAPSPNQYSEVTLGTIAGGGGGPMVRIDRNSLT